MSITFTVGKEVCFTFQPDFFTFSVPKFRIFRQKSSFTSGKTPRKMPDFRLISRPPDTVDVNDSDVKQGGSTIASAFSDFCVFISFAIFCPGSAHENTLCCNPRPSFSHRDTGDHTRAIAGIPAPSNPPSGHPPPARGELFPRRPSGARQHHWPVRSGSV